MSEPKQLTNKLPTLIRLNKKTTFSLNLNQYRNAHFHILNKAKVLFEEAIADQVIKLPKMERLIITYFYFNGTKRQSDVANICSVVDKFFSDTLVNKGIIEDDNFDVLEGVTYRYGGYRKGDTCVEADITYVERNP